MPLASGDKVDRYTILGLLGSGGMGEVYRVRDERLQRTIALKLVRPTEDELATASQKRGEIGKRSSGQMSTGGAARLLREARAAAALDHPNVVHIYDVGEVQEPESLRGMTYLAMELIKGKTLRAFVGDASIPFSKRLGWLKDVARALAAAHEAGLVHRDMKPENVMVRDDGIVKVLDFGIAKRAAGEKIEGASSIEGQIIPTLTTKGVVIGTPYYMSPEQMRNEALDGRSDQFSWAVMAYELLTGTTPWTAGAEALHLVAEILSREPESPSKRNPEVPRHIEAALLGALRKNRDERFASMGDLLGALEGGARARAATERHSVPDASGAQANAHAPTEPHDSLQDAAKAISEKEVPAVAHEDDDRTLRSAGRISSIPARSLVAAAAASAPPPVPSAAPAPPRTPQISSRSRPPPPSSQPQRSRSILYAAGAFAAIALVLVALGLARRGKGASGALGSGASGSAAVPSADPSRECATVRDCVAKHPGTKMRCAKPSGVCVALESPDCKASAEPADFDNDDTVWIGAMYPVTGESATWGKTEANAVELARRDFRQTLGATTGRSGRPIGVVTCDVSVNPKRAAQHLVTGAGVPAVVGFHDGDAFIEMAREIMVPARVVSMVTLSTAPQATAVPQPNEQERLVWRTTYSAASTAPPLAALVGQVLEPDVRKAISNEPMRVAVVSPKDFGGDAFREAMFTSLRFNGKSAMENDRAYAEVAIPRNRVEDPKLDDFVARLVAHAPHVVVYAMGPFQKSIVEPLEAAWPAGLSFRPRYATMSVFERDVFDFIGSNAERRRRFYGLTNVSTTMPNARLVAHYNTSFDDKITRTVSPNSTYDAFYLLAYAVYALGDKAVTGESLAHSMRTRLMPPGTPVDVGPGHIFDGFKVLSSGGNVDLNGAIGRLDFNAKTGEAPIDMAILCVNVDSKGKAFDSVESGLIFNATAQKLEGALKCP